MAETSETKLDYRF